MSNLNGPNHAAPNHAGPNHSVLGIDLGTSNTVAVVRRPDGTVRSLLFDGTPVVPSAVWLGDDGELIVGRDAQRMAALQPERYEPNPKRRIDDGTLLLGETAIPVTDALAGILRSVAAKATETAGYLPPTIFTHPAAWGGPRRQIFASAIQQAGFVHPQFIPEPVAAAQYYTDTLDRRLPIGKALAVLDFGGGTLDIAVVRRDPTGHSVLGYGGLDDLGGADLDEVTAEILSRVLIMSHPETLARLTDPRSVTDRRMRRAFWEDIRAAKEMLSRTTSAPVPIPGCDDTVHVTREEFDTAVRPLIARGIRETVAVLRRSRIDPRQLAGLFLVGGASRTPLLARELHVELGIAATVLDQPELPVAEGSVRSPNLPTHPGRPMPAARSNPPGPRPVGPPGSPSGVPNGTGRTSPGHPPPVPQPYDIPPISPARPPAVPRHPLPTPSPGANHQPMSQPPHSPPPYPPNPAAPQPYSPHPMPLAGASPSGNPMPSPVPPQRNHRPTKTSFAGIAQIGAGAKRWAWTWGIILAGVFIGVTPIAIRTGTPAWIIISPIVLIVVVIIILVATVTARKNRVHVDEAGIGFSHGGRFALVQWNDIAFWDIGPGPSVDNPTSRRQEKLTVQTVRVFPVNPYTRIQGAAEPYWIAKAGFWRVAQYTGFNRAPEDVIAAMEYFGAAKRQRGL